tara:strand:+ start:94403 stop:96622 length:2220 start_codon:yes stop_codon:yes gene_type:complete
VTLLKHSQLRLFGPVFLLFLLQSFYSFSQKQTYPDTEKTAFQTSSKWIPEIDTRADIAIVYGVNGNPSDHSKMETFEERAKSWKDHGYNIHFMTGIAWGSYQDYFLGKWDGINHLGEGQVQQNGDTIWHGRNVPYIVPSDSFIAYIKESVIERVINAGITSIYFEEPEFWARAGYSSAFKKEWQKYYGFPWRPQDASPENTWLANKLKYELYYNTLKETSAYAKAYGKKKGLDVKVYIPTHSLVNYSSWSIVSPEASLASLPGIDGYIAQVWTGTSREPTYFNGLKKERTFENAFLEYGSMVSMTAPTGRKMFFLTDPIEDRKKTWEDYKQNYQATFAAELLYPMMANYEVMPWPERIYTAPYQVANSDKKVLIPKDYSTQMQIMINALNKMPVSDNHVSGNQGIGVLMGNSLMFQRFPTHDNYDDPQFSNFYGQTLPLVKRGIPVETVHMENLQYSETLKNIKVLVMSYSNMKPNNSEVHKYISDWVKKGGVLVYVGKDDDPYQNVMEWWNTGKNHYKTPSEHLFQLLDINNSPTEKNFKVGKGMVHIIDQNPKEFVLNKNGDKPYLDVIKEAYEQDTKAGKIEFKNNFFLQRGPYQIISVMDESVSTKVYKSTGLFIDLFDPKLPILEEKITEPGDQSFLYDLSSLKNSSKFQVLASAARISNELSDIRSYSFIAKSPVNTVNSMRILLPHKPANIEIINAESKEAQSFEKSWEAGSKTLWLQFNNSSDGIKVIIEF